MLNKKIETKDLFTCETDYLEPLFNSVKYPWEIIPKIKEYVRRLVADGIDGFTEISEGVLAGKNVSISPTATIEAPTILGSGTQVRPGAYIRGFVITGADCVLGNSSEFKNCILLNKVQAPHYNYVGDSILGNGSHLGAGTVCSNLKGDGKSVVIHSDIDYETGIRKLGGILADGVDVGCGCVLNPGTIIGKNTRVYPLNSLRGVFAGGCIVKKPDDVIIMK